MVQVIRRKNHPAPSSTSKRIERVLSILGALNIIGIILILQNEQPGQNHGGKASDNLQKSLMKHQDSIDYHLEQKYTHAKLQDLGVTITDPQILKRLPPWWMIQQQYGNAPRILGLERCNRYRESTSQILLGPAGLFNSGTNLISQLLQNNCALPQSPHHFAFQAPWGKHTPADYRGVYTIPHDHYKAMDMKSVLPIVTIRHPYDWMKSTCRVPYAVRWPHGVNDGCPNLVDPYDNSTIPVTVLFGVGNHTYPTLMHLWNRWYRQYYDSVSYPRLMVRMEDLLFYPKETITQICDCVGGSMDVTGFTVLAQSAKGYANGHGNHKTGLVDGWIKYGNRRTYERFTPTDWSAAREIVDKDMLEYFGYLLPLP
jgi:hypothetical protein